jgi:hypothetical protein
MKKNVARLQASEEEGRLFNKEEGEEPASKYLGPTKKEAEYWYKVFSGKQKDDES